MISYAFSDCAVPLSRDSTKVRFTCRIDNHRHKRATVGIGQLAIKTYGLDQAFSPGIVIPRPGFRPPKDGRDVRLETATPRVPDLTRPGSIIESFLQRLCCSTAETENRRGTQDRLLSSSRAIVLCMSGSLSLSSLQTMLPSKSIQSRVMPVDPVRHIRNPDKLYSLWQSLDLTSRAPPPPPSGDHGSRFFRHNARWSCCNPLRARFYPESHC